MCSFRSIRARLSWPSWFVVQSMYRVWCGLGSRGGAWIARCALLRCAKPRCPMSGAPCRGVPFHGFPMLSSRRHHNRRDRSARIPYHIQPCETPTQFWRCAASRPTSQARLGGETERAWSTGYDRGINQKPNSVAAHSLRRSCWLFWRPWGRRGCGWRICRLLH